MIDISGAPASLARWWSDSTPRLGDVMYRPNQADDQSLSLEAALHLLRDSKMDVPAGLVPVSFLDDWSFASLSMYDNDEYGWKAGQIVRWHLDDIEPTYQGALLDVDLDSYVPSLLAEFGPAWDKGYQGFRQLAADYRKEFVEPNETPKAHHRRPFQLACQNYIIGLAAFQRDVRIDSESVPFWLTCEAPHVATNEGNRTLSALMLCDAFQSGGTMEISFARHAENRVPASLRRYGRTLGIELGAEIKGGKSISPTEARRLFGAVTPMPNELRARCEQLVRDGVSSIERLCYSLLSPVWSAAALDFLLACCSGDRIGSILEGGADVLDRPNRGAEMEIARAALMVEMLVKRCDSKDSIAADHDGQEVRLFEDTTHGVTWRVIGEIGAVELRGLPVGPVPWNSGLMSDGRLLVIPRPHPIHDDLDLARRLAAGGLAQGAPVALLTSEWSVVVDAAEISQLVCPVRPAELDLQIERNLVSSSLARA